MTAIQKAREALVKSREAMSDSEDFGVFIAVIAKIDAALAALDAETEVKVREAASVTEAANIGDAVLTWMVKNDLLDANNEYYASDVLAVLDDLTTGPLVTPEARS